MLYKPHCKELNRHHSGGIISGCWKDSTLFGHTEGILEPGNFQAAVGFKNRYCGEVTDVSYEMELDDSLSLEENLNRFQEQVELFHGLFLEAHLLGLTGGTEGDIAFPDAFRRKLLRDQGKEDISIHETDDLNIRFSYDVKSVRNPRFYVLIQY